MLRSLSRCSALILMAGFALLSAPAGAQPFSPSLDLSTLNGANGFVLNGIDPSDYSGWSVSAAGDVNGDGIGDVIIGAYAADPNGINKAGESYIVFGGPAVGAGGTLSLPIGVLGLAGLAAM